MTTISASDASKPRMHDLLSAQAHDELEKGLADGTIVRMRIDPDTLHGVRISPEAQAASDSGNPPATVTPAAVDVSSLKAAAQRRMTRLYGADGAQPAQAISRSFVFAGALSVLGGPAADGAS
jgi:hypothetical protein